MTACNDLVLVPGLNNTHAVFDGVVKTLPAEVRAYAVNNPALDSVDAIAQALLPNLPNRFWLAGFSFGGYVALAILAAAPERVQGIAMLCTAPFADSPEAASKRQASVRAVEEGRYFELIEQQVGNAFHPDSLSDAVLMAAREQMVRDYGPERYAAHVRATSTRPDRMALLDGRRPTLVLTASHDKVFPPESVCDYGGRIPGVQQKRIEGAGHLVPMEKPAEVADALARWMGVHA